MAAVLCLFLMLGFCLPFACAADTEIHSAPQPVPETATSSNCDDLTKKVIAKEIELERFNLNYCLETSKVDRFKGTRYFLLQESNLALLNAGFIGTVAERSAHMSSPRKNKHHYA